MVLVFLLGKGLHAEIIDRIVAVVENRIITLSDIRQERDIQAVLGEGAKSDSEILEELVQRRLVEMQVEQFPAVEVSPSYVDAELVRIRDERGVSDAPDGFIEALRRAIRSRLEASMFIDLRFRQFIRVSDQEAEQYYEEVFLPEARNRGLTPIPPLNEVDALVRNNVTEEKLKQSVDSWLETIRMGADIEVFD